MLALLFPLLATRAWAWGPHSEITRAAIDALPPHDPIVTLLGPALNKEPQYCWLGDQRQTLIVRRDETFYADDYLLFPPLPRHTDHLLPDVRRTYAPHFRRALQALRTETPVNAARWIGSLLHFVEDSGSPPHAAEIRGEMHTRMENWVDAKQISLAGYAPQFLGDSDDAAEAGFLRRMEGLVAFSKERAQRCRADVEAGNRAAVEPVVLESALETSRVVADLLHTLGIVAAQPAAAGEAGAQLVGNVRLGSGLGKLDKLPAKVVLLGTNFSTLSDDAGRFELHHLPAGHYRVACFGPGGLADVREIDLSPRQSAVLTSAAAAGGGGLMRNPRFEMKWVSPTAADGWAPVARSSKSAPGWQSEWLPLELGTDYRLVIRWKHDGGGAAGNGDVVVRFKRAVVYGLPEITSAPIASPTAEFRVTPSEQKGTWVQVFIRTPGQPGDLLESIDLLPATAH